MGDVQAGADGIVSPTQLRAEPPSLPLLRPAFEAPSAPSSESIGRIAYETHRAQLPGPRTGVRSSSSAPTRRAVPVGDTLPWERLTAGQQAHWVAVARAVAHAVGR